MKMMDSEVGRTDKVSATYLVMSVSEIDREVYAILSEADHAKPDPDKPGSYIVTNKQAGRSQSVMPRVLNPLGRKGWLLCAVNKMECYVFRQLAKNMKVEYKVLTPADLDAMAVKRLQHRGVMKLASFEGETPVLEVTDPGAVRIQQVLPETLAELSAQGWYLTAINGPQLYFFARPIE